MSRADVAGWLRWCLIGLVSAVYSAAGDAPVRGETQVRPVRGTLLIVGGGSMAKLWPEFLALAGGRDAAIVVIPTADETVTADERSVAALRALGATRVTQLHTRDPKVADTEEFVAPLRTARAVWITGGRQWRLADAYQTDLPFAPERDFVGAVGFISEEKRGPGEVG